MKRRTFIKLSLATGGLVLTGCTCSTAHPKDPHWHQDTCAHCRMTVSEPAFAAQIVGPGYSWRYYDDLGCALKDLDAKPELAEGKLFVRPGQDGAWTPADAARYAEGVKTPMNYGFAATDSGTLSLDQVRRRLSESKGGMP